MKVPSWRLTPQPDFEVGSKTNLPKLWPIGVLGLSTDWNLLWHIYDNYFVLTGFPQKTSEGLIRSAWDLCKICKDIENKNKIVLERSARLKLETKPSGISTPIFGPLLQKLPESTRNYEKVPPWQGWLGWKSWWGWLGWWGVRQVNQVIQVNQVKGEKKEKSLVSGEEREGEEKKTSCWRVGGSIKGSARGPASRT